MFIERKDLHLRIISIQERIIAENYYEDVKNSTDNNHSETPQHDDRNLLDSYDFFSPYGNITDIGQCTQINDINIKPCSPVNRISGISFMSPIEKQQISQVQSAVIYDNPSVNNSKKITVNKQSREFQRDIIKRLHKRFNNIYTPFFKGHIKYYANIFGIKQTCKDFKLSKKNVERWAENGAERKKGCGRKSSNGHIKLKMHEWAVNFTKTHKSLPTCKLVMIEAKKYVYEHFAASKGWAYKFMRNVKLEISRLLD